MNKYKKICNILVWRYLIYFVLAIVFVVLASMGISDLGLDGQGYGWMFVFAIWCSILWAPLALTEITTNIIAVVKMNSMYKRGIFQINKVLWVIQTICSGLFCLSNLILLLFLGIKSVLLWLVIGIIIVLGFTVFVLNIIITTLPTKEIYNEKI